MAPTLWRYLISAGSLAATIWVIAATGVLPVQDAAAALVVPAVFVIIGALGPHFAADRTACWHLIALGSLHLVAMSLCAVALRVPHELAAASLNAASQSAYALGFALFVRIAVLYPDFHHRPWVDIVLIVAAVLPVVAAFAAPSPTVLQPGESGTTVLGPIAAVLPEEFAAAGFAVFLLPLGAAVILVLRFLRGSPVLRRKLVWPLLGLAAVALLAITGGLLSGALAPSLTDALFLVAAPLLPLSLAAGSRPADAPLNLLMTRLTHLTEDRDRLRTDVRSHLAALEARTRELSESRSRLEVAADLERRRVQADLHDGVQQELLALMTRIATAQARLPVHSPAHGELASAAELAKGAYESVRGVAGGIVPSDLSDLGLIEAVTSWADRLPLPVRVQAANLSTRPRPVVETAAFYFVREALTNVIKHADAHEAIVQIAQEQNRLRIEVADSGRGGLDPALGSGLQGLRDRIEAVGGRFSFAESDGWTRLRAEFPTESPSP